MASFKQKSPRESTNTLVECYAKPILFEPWENLSEEVKYEFMTNGPIPCEGGGVPGMWCDGCRFGKVYEPTVHY